MKDIDFLPSGYRQQHSRHHDRIWRVVVVVGFLAMLCAASLVQYSRLCFARSCLDQLTDERAAAENQDAQRTRLQSQLKEVNADAELFTYLCHPWPRTQILAALLAPLPDTVTLDQLEIKVDSPLRSRRRQPAQRREGDQDDQPAPLLPADRDLAMLREQLDSARVLAVLSGSTTDSAALHRYLSELDRTSLFAKVELDSLTSPAATGKNVPEGVMSFKAVVVVRPGYGQPNGPTGSVQIALRPAATADHGDRTGPSGARRASAARSQPMQSAGGKP